MRHAAHAVAVAIAASRPLLPPSPQLLPAARSHRRCLRLDVGTGEERDEAGATAESGGDCSTERRRAERGHQRSRPRSARTGPAAADHRGAAVGAAGGGAAAQGGGRSPQSAAAGVQEGRGAVAAADAPRGCYRLLSRGASAAALVSCPLPDFDELPKCSQGNTVRQAKLESFVARGHPARRRGHRSGGASSRGSPWAT